MTHNNRKCFRFLLFLRAQFPHDILYVKDDEQDGPKRCLATRYCISANKFLSLPACGFRERKRPYTKRSFRSFRSERALLLRLGGSSTRSSAISDDRAVRQRSPIAYSRLAFATSRPIYHSAGRRRVVTQDGSTPLSDSALEASGKIAQTCRQIFSYSGAESRNGSKADSRPIRFEASR